jgi:hypothetical protein
MLNSTSNNNLERKEFEIGKEVEQKLIMKMKEILIMKE